MERNKLAFEEVVEGVNSFTVREATGFLYAKLNRMTPPITCYMATTLKGEFVLHFEVPVVMHLPGPT